MAIKVNELLRVVNYYLKMWPNNMIRSANKFKIVSNHYFSNISPSISNKIKSIRKIL